MVLGTKDLKCWVLGLSGIDNPDGRSPPKGYHPRGPAAKTENPFPPSLPLCTGLVASSYEKWLFEQLESPMRLRKTTCTWGVSIGTDP